MQMKALWAGPALLLTASLSAAQAASGSAAANLDGTSQPATASQIQQSTQPERTPSAFVPESFTVPTQIVTPDFKLVPLGPELVRTDYVAYMSSIKHLQKTFSRSTAWPRNDISDADAMQDMLNEQARFKSRSSFAYAVLTPDGTREIGSVYVRPSKVTGYDAEVRMWVTKADYDAGFDRRLYAWVTGWIGSSWPFRNVAYPGRAIDWASWDAQVAASARQKQAMPNP